MKFMEFVERYGKMGIIRSKEVVALSNNPAVLRLQMHQWQKKGYLVPLKRGVYLLNPPFQGRKIPLFYISNELVIPSYVSLESALSYYGLIPEGIFRGIIAVSTRKTVVFSNRIGVFYYHHLKPSLFTGFERIEMDGYRVNIALPEKALLDYLYLRRVDTRDIEGMRLQNIETLEPETLVNLASLFPERVEKIVRRLKDEIIALRGA